jgi:citrate lyase synthetase
MPAVIFVSGKVFMEIEVVDADRGAGSLHKVITHLRIIAFESRRTHT